MNARGEVDGPANWLAADLEANHAWCRELTAGEIDELDAALSHVRDRNPELDLASMTVDDFPLPTFAAEVDNLRRVLVDGCGAFAYTGVPVDRYDDDELRALWWGLCLSIGTPVAQSWRGDVIGDVRDIGTGVTGRAGRGYTSNSELSFHCDTADVTGLFVLRQGKTGVSRGSPAPSRCTTRSPGAGPTCSNCSINRCPSAGSRTRCRAPSSGTTCRSSATPATTWRLRT